MQNCPQCGSPARAGEAYCRSCGTPLVAEARGISPAPLPDPERNRWTLPADGRPARHAPSARRRRSRIAPNQIRLIAIAGVVLVIIAAAVLILPGLFQPAGTTNGTTNGTKNPPASSWFPSPAVQCSAGQTLCSGKCVDLKIDSDNCGGCGFSVPYGDTCINGQFSSVVLKANHNSSATQTTPASAGPAAAGTTAGTCPTGLWPCGGSCVDPGSDRNNCGACGTVCPSIGICQNGRCVLATTSVVATTTGTVAPDLSCSRDEMACNGSCVDIFTDKKNCGVCGRSCKADEFCVDARCGPACMNNGTSLCSGSCVDLTTDPENCGTCGTECKSFLPHAKGSTCEDAKCVISGCNTGYGDCDTSVANGCESNLQTDASNCGTCGTKCPAGQVCYSGKCSVPFTM